MTVAGSPIKHERNRVWREAIMRALAKKGAEGDVIAALEPIADKLVEMSLAGEISHMKELGDRLDGKAAQQVVLASPHEDDPNVRELTIKLVKPE